jgi:serine/threonine protein kinase
VYPTSVRGKPAPVSLPQPGETLGGKYAIVRVVGEGGMGTVYEATHTRLRHRVAIKVLMPNLLHMADVVARFEREGRTAAQLRGRHVAHVLDVDVTDGGLPYMVMEYLEGRDLDSELQERGRLPVPEAVDYVLQACDAMAEAHAAGIVHRDLKPANLFLCPETSGRVVKVLDFGISKITSDDDARLTGTHATVGTPLYMSPEQVRSPKSVDSRTDIWSLGVILFELLTGRTPFLGSTTGAAASIVIDPVPSMRDLGVELPEALEAAILRSLEKDPGRRFADVRSFASSIASFAAAISPRRTSHPSATEPGADRSDAALALELPTPAGSGPNVASTLSGAETMYAAGHVLGAAPDGALAARLRSPAMKPPVTAPGWTTQSAPRSRGWTRALFVILPVAAIAGYLALWRWSDAGEHRSAPTANPAVAAAATPPSAPLPPVPPPAASESGTLPTPPPTSSSTAPKTSPASTVHRPPPRPPPAASKGAAPAPDGKPLFLTP